MSVAAVDDTQTSGAVSGPALLAYLQDMLLELAHMASNGGEAGLAASLAIAAVQAGERLRTMNAAGG